MSAKSDKKNLRFECKECPRKFATSWERYEHVRMAHNAKRTVVCNFCDKKFFNTAFLRIHMTVSHPSEKSQKSDQFKIAEDIKPVECPHCPLTYSSRKSMRKHVCRKHKDIIQTMAAELKNKDMRPKSKLSGFIQFSERLICKEKDAAKRKLNESRTENEVPVASTSHIKSERISNPSTPKKQTRQHRDTIELDDSPVNNENYIDVHFQCNWCERTFPNDNRLRMHTASEHGKTLPRKSTLGPRMRYGASNQLPSLALKTEGPSYYESLTIEQIEIAKNEILSGRHNICIDLTRDHQLIKEFYYKQTIKKEKRKKLPPSTNATAVKAKKTTPSLKTKVKPKNHQKSSSSILVDNRQKAPKRPATPPFEPILTKRERKVPRNWDEFEYEEPDLAAAVKRSAGNLSNDATENTIKMPRVRHFENQFAISDGFECYVCKQTFSSETLEPHFKTKHKHFPKDQCYVCGKRYSCIDNFRVHLKTVHFGIFNYQCTRCDRAYYYYTKLVKHFLLHHMSDNPPSREECQIENGLTMPRANNLKPKPQELREGYCRCIICKSVHLSGKLREHVEIHHKNFPKTRCFVCGDRFLNPKATVEHIDFVHFKKPKHTCDECQNEFETIQSWKDHLEKIHQCVEMYKCEHCDRAFGWRKFLRQHIRSEHAGENGSVFAMRSDFRAAKTTLQEEVDRQMNITTDDAEKPEPAPISANSESVVVNESYEPSNSVMEYEYEMSGIYNPARSLDEEDEEEEEYEDDGMGGNKKAINVNFFGPNSIDVCPICKKVLHTKKSLRTHIEAIHHKVRRYTCEICEHQFYARCDLKKHVDCVHNRVKTYSCNQCGKGFFMHSQLAMHLVNQHKSTLPFKCNECGRRYAIKQVYNDHVWRFHTVKPKRIRVNGKLTTPSSCRNSIANAKNVPDKPLPPPPVVTQTEVIQSFPAGQQEIYLIGNQLYYAENVVTVNNSDDGTFNQGMYEAIQIDGQPTQFTFQQPGGIQTQYVTDTGLTTGYMTDGNSVATQYITEDGTPILLDATTGEAILNQDELQPQPTVASSAQNVQSIVAMTSGSDGASQASTAQVAGTVVQHEAPDGSMQPVYLTYQSF